MALPPGSSKITTPPHDRAYDRGALDHGQNNGAKKFDGERKKVSLCVATERSHGGGSGMMFFVLRPCCAFSRNNKETIDQRQHIDVRSFIFVVCLLFISVRFARHQKRTMYAIWIGLYRQIRGARHIFICRTKIFHLGLRRGIWWGHRIVTWSAAIVTGWYARRVLAA